MASLNAILVILLPCILASTASLMLLSRHASLPKDVCTCKRLLASVYFFDPCTLSRCECFSSQLRSFSPVLSMWLAFVVLFIGTLIRSHLLRGRSVRKKHLLLPSPSLLSSNCRKIERLVLVEHDIIIDKKMCYQGQDRRSVIRAWTTLGKQSA